MNGRHGSFFAELQRRNVYKVAIAYIVAAWALAQGLAQVLPVFDVPNWVVRVLIVLLVLGFPVALAIAWLYEITPEGIKRTEEVDPEHSISRHTGRKIVALTAGLATIALALLLFHVVGRDRWAHSLGKATSENAQATRPSLPVSAKSIAVLPFENQSDDKSTAYFAEGIQDEILTRLSKIADLKVISRTSTEQYKSTPENLREIARQLGVAHIVEGGVQKSGDAVRINVQLIKAADDSHLWADTFDRKLTDLFSVESEVAKAIADQLGARLTGAEQQFISHKSTENTAAYDAYLRGLAYTLKTAPTIANAVNAQKYLKEAVRLDPQFDLAWALLSIVDSRNYLTHSLPPTLALREEAREAMETALKLNPKLGEAIWAKGFYYYACLRDYETAAGFLEEARRLLPNNSRLPESLAYLERRRGHWERSEAYLQEAEQLDPRNVALLSGHATSYICQRRFSQALLKLQQVLDIVPADADTIATEAMIAQAEGDLAKAGALLRPLQSTGEDTVVQVQSYQAVLERRPADVIPRLRQVLATEDTRLGYFSGELRFWLGWAETMAGEASASTATWNVARQQLEALLKEQPDNFGLISDLALIDTGLGQHDAAFHLAEEAGSMKWMRKDALEGPAITELLARIAAQSGEPDRAIDALEKIVSVPYSGLINSVPLTRALLRLDPMFDQLRGNPRFEKLLSQPPQPE